jgi:FkbM family methyltransferase
LLYETDVARRAPVLLFDVGCSGGVEPHWFHFGKALHAVGFDPLIAEVDRLNAEAGRQSTIRYEAAFIGCNNYDELFPPPLRQDRIASRSNESFQRTSAAAHAQLKSIDYIKENFNRGAEVVLATTHTQLDDYVAQNAIERVDLLKVDTDGHDIEVLLGARNLLKGCLAVCVEAQFHGAVHPHANIFSNIDLLLRELGFTLIDIEPLRYTRATLPGEFAHDMAAQTVGGSIQWAEAIYARDLADPDYERKHPFTISREDVFKLAAFLDIFGLQDCAAELLLSRRDLVAQQDDHTLEDLLNMITPDALGPGRTYASYMSEFRKDPSALYPSRVRATMPASPAISNGEPVASDAGSDVELKAALASAEAARAEVTALRRSTSWRMTAPLRALVNLARKPG